MYINLHIFLYIYTEILTPSPRLRCAQPGMLTGTRAGLLSRSHTSWSCHALGTALPMASGRAGSVLGAGGAAGGLGSELA